VVIAAYAKILREGINIINKNIETLFDVTTNTQNTNKENYAHFNPSVKECKTISYVKTTG
jgi:hypothetical protein